MERGTERKRKKNIWIERINALVNKEKGKNMPGGS